MNSLSISRKNQPQSLESIDIGLRELIPLILAVIVGFATFSQNPSQWLSILLLEIVFIILYSCIIYHFKKYEKCFDEIKGRLSEIERETEDPSYTIIGRKNVYEKGMKMVSNATSEIRTWWCLKDEKPPIEYLELVSKKAQEKLARFYRVYNLRYTPQKDHARNLLKKLAEAGKIKEFSIRHTDQVNVEGIIVDDKEALISFPTQGAKEEVSAAIYTKHRDFVVKLSHWYDVFLFNKAKEVKTIDEIDKIK